jgi:superfamily I DNA/RNA helicase
MGLHPAVEQRLAKLAPDQRAAASAPPGPVLCVAPAGSGKTTTLVARITWLVDTGTPPDQVCAVTFNKRAAEELAERLASALEPLGVDGATVRVRTFHALGRVILRSAGVPVEPLLDRGLLLRRLFPSADRARLRQLDDRFSRLKLDRGLTLEAVAADPSAVEDGPAFVAYETAVRESGGLDFDDLVVRALHVLETTTDALERWRLACSQLLVDEVQDVDRTQLRLALLLAAPAHRIFLVGDDDQSIYGWRLADVKQSV